MRKPEDYTDADVEDAKELHDALVPNKAAMLVKTLNSMDKHGETAYSKVRHVVLSMADWFKYGN